MFILAIIMLHMTYRLHTNYMEHHAVCFHSDSVNIDWNFIGQCFNNEQQSY